MTRPRRGRLRVVEVEAKRPPIPLPDITIAGGSVGMTPEVAQAIEEAIDKGRRKRRGLAS